MSLYVAGNATNHALQSLSGSALGEIVCTVGNHILYTGCPTDATRQLGNQIGLDFSGIGVWLSIHILIDRTLRSLELRSLNGCL